MSESNTPNIPLQPEDQARLDKLVTEMRAAHTENPLNLFVIDVPTAEWVRNGVTEEQWHHAFDVAEAGDPDVPTSGPFGVDLGDGTLWGPFAPGPAPIEVLEAHAELLGCRLVRFSDPVPASSDVPETFAA